MGARVFVGGAYDHKLLFLEEHVHQAEISILDRIPVGNPDDIVSPYVPVRHEYYSERLIRGGSTTFAVFVLDGISDAEMMQRLIEGYVREETGNDAKEMYHVQGR